MCSITKKGYTMNKRIMALKRLRDTFKSIYMNNPDSLGLRLKIDLLTTEIIRLNTIQIIKIKFN